VSTTTRRPITPDVLDARALARSRIRHRRRRATTIQRTTTRASLVLLAALWVALFLQLTLGSDPGLARKRVPVVASTARPARRRSHHSHHSHAAGATAAAAPLQSSTTQAQANHVPPAQTPATSQPTYTPPAQTYTPPVSQAVAPQPATLVTSQS
jgi:hypothetical protein